jgi:membrane protease YdiL (CAAX protease family)
MKAKALVGPFLYVVGGVILAWTVLFFNNAVHLQLASQFPQMHPFVNDLLSDAVLLLIAWIPILAAPRFFGAQPGTISRHWKLISGLAIFLVGAPLLYRLLMGETPFGANTWFFEGVVVPVAEEGFFRGIVLSILLWAFASLYRAGTASTLALIFSSLIFAAAHLNNLGHYPTSFILFQVGFSTVLGLLLGYTRVKTDSIYPAILLHALFNLAGTL